MGNLLGTLKKFFTNKNTVTILGVLAGVIVLWVFYNYRVNDAIKLERIPVATRDLIATEQITAKDIEFLEVNSAFLRDVDVITNQNLIVNYYVNVGTSIPAGGMFYTSQVVEKKELPNSVFDNIPKDNTIFQLPVNNTTTYANSIYPGDRIDLYLRTSVDGKTIYGPLVESIEVLAVRDSSGQNVFDSSTTRTAAWLLFAVPSVKESGENHSLYTLLENIKNISGMTLYPVPKNKSYTEEAGETRISSEYLRDLAESFMAATPDV